MVRVVFKVPRETGSQTGKVTLELQSQGSHKGGILGKIDRPEPHNRREPLSRNLAADGEEITWLVLVGTISNMNEVL